MFVRVTWSKLPSTTGMDAAVQNYRDKILPSLKTQTGFLGGAVLANAETGEGTTVSYWEDAAALAASEPMATAGRAEATQQMGIQIQEVDRFELLVNDRAKPSEAGAFVRVNDVRASAAQIDATVAFLRENALPKMKTLDGYRALMILANRESGRMLVTTVWDTAAEREASDTAATPMRRQAADMAQAQNQPKVTLYQSMLVDVSAAVQQGTTAAAGAA